MEMTNIELLNRYRTLGLVEAEAGTITIGGKEFNRKDGYTKNFIDSKTGKYRVFQRSGFIKVFKGEGKDISDVIESDAELGKMYRIMKCIDRDNMIMYSSHRSKKSMPANKQHLIEMTNMSKDRGRKFISKMEKLGVIREARIGESVRFFINPIYTMADVGISLILYKLFRDELMFHLPEQAIEDLDMMNYIDLHPDVLVSALEEEEAIQKEEERMLGAQIDQMTGKSLAERNEREREREDARPKRNSSPVKEDKASVANQKILAYMKKSSKHINGTYIGSEDEAMGLEEFNDVMLAIFDYERSKRTEADRQTFIDSKAGRYYILDEEPEGFTQLLGYHDTEDKNRLQTATVHNR